MKTGGNLEQTQTQWWASHLPPLVRLRERKRLREREGIRKGEVGEGGQEGAEAVEGTEEAEETAGCLLTLIECSTIKYEITGQQQLYSVMQIGKWLSV